MDSQYRLRPSNKTFLITAVLTLFLFIFPLPVYSETDNEERLIQKLNHIDPKLREQAVIELMETGDTAAVEHLIPLPPGRGPG